MDLTGKAITDFLRRCKGISDSYLKLLYNASVV